VLAIIGAVLAAIQLIVAATGADNFKKRYELHLENKRIEFSDLV